MAKDLLEKQQMIEYLRCALRLEVNAYAAREMINQMSAKANMLGKHDEYIPKPETTGIIGLIFGSFFGGLFATLKYFIIVGCIAAAFGDLFIYIFFVWFFGVPVIIFIISYGDQSKKIKEYNRKKNEQRSLNEEELSVKKELENRIVTLRRSLNETTNILSRFYSPNIIYSKYRDVVALAQILEYYESGRRDRLEGEGGAYDLFEYELKQEIIIANLVEIRKQLSRIQCTQTLLYNELRNTNNMLSSISGEISRISSSMNRIAIDSHISAYNSAIIASQQGATNYMNTYNHYF